METTKWVVDPTHSEVQFKIKHLVISNVTGAFKKFEGSAEISDDDFSNANIEFTVDINSVDTNQEQRDTHLKSADFFDAEKYPQLKFKSDAFTKTSDDEYELTGDLTIKDSTKRITLAVEHGGTAVDAYGNTKAGFEVKGQISRKEFGLMWNSVTEAGSVVARDTVKIIINLQLIKQA